MGILRVNAARSRIVATSATSSVTSLRIAARALMQVWICVSHRASQLHQLLCCCASVSLSRVHSPLLEQTKPCFVLLECVCTTKVVLSIICVILLNRVHIHGFVWCVWFCLFVETWASFDCLLACSFSVVVLLWSSLHNLYLFIHFSVNRSCVVGVCTQDILAVCTSVSVHGHIEW